MRILRGVLILIGFGAGLFGGELLFQLGRDNLVATAVWFGGGVVVHDGVLAPATILVAVVAARLVGHRLPGAVIVGGIVLGSVTLVAVPMLGRFGERADNHTLLDRSYGVGWLVFAGLTMLVTAVAVLRGSEKGGNRGTGPGGR